MADWDAEVAVVGLGAWGSAALWRLAARGVSVVGVERYRPGHAFGSSHGGSRMFRVTCLEHPGLVPLARRSLGLWRELEGASSTPLFQQSGGLLIGPPDGTIVGGTLAAAAEHDIEVQRWRPDELAERCPAHAAVPDDHLGVWEPSAGIIAPERAVRAAVSVAQWLGARVCTGTTVDAIDLVPGGVVVRTAARDLRVRRVVVAAGAWLPSLVPGLPLTVLRMPITWYRPLTAPETFELERFPVFMRERESGVIVWGNGRESGHEVKLGLEDQAGHRRLFDPETDDRGVVPEDWTALSGELATAVPGLEPLPAKVGVCMFAATPDNQFVLGSPGDPRIVVAGGCNAHGFKHATGIGEALADLAIGKDPFCDLSFTDAARFG